MNKLYLLFVPLVFTLFMSCNSRDNNDSSDQKKMMISKITVTSFDNPASPDVSVQSFKYNTSGDVIEIKSGNSGNYVAVDYTADKKISKIDHYKNNKGIEYTENFTYLNDQLIKIVAEYENKAFNRIIDYTYDNNGNLKTTSICEGPPCGNPWKTTFDYIGNNVSRKTESGAGSSSISVNEYTYDNKSNPSVNMNKYLRIVFGYQDLIGSNNILTEKIYTNRMVITYTIDYNAEGLPVKSLGKDEKGNNWVQYNYEYIRL
ncbi:hypothetical protein BAZ12_04715 [Elizabethkingia miricola]|uniref:DUF4595 domain-containing protein n=1 Tax=Elizabethkingia miricola TaxID=172045 RepID=A0ABD4DMU7_ELIMR|nr:MULTISPECIES: hypothetical protein [Elizabethkingia]KUY19678.1 hypothetical protein ATB95_01720 [Elizabethkingia miricola]MCL1651310.1 hypothetical protein [Elizabethkingia miricola]MCL1678420.1 hypothetical protein [Elizabethkingia miricola]OPC71356.1 hypothetical protein BAZ13_07790 [Elizabethkingia miricola]OPC73099.1 hypothetical protein BAZ12_04715 [Elizabethkingia miricola]